MNDAASEKILQDLARGFDAIFKESRCTRIRMDAPCGAKLDAYGKCFVCESWDFARSVWKNPGAE